MAKKYQINKQPGPQVLQVPQVPEPSAVYKVQTTWTRYYQYQILQIPQVLQVPDFSRLQNTNNLGDNPERKENASADEEDFGADRADLRLKQRLMTKIAIPSTSQETRSGINHGIKYACTEIPNHQGDP